MKITKENIEAILFDYAEGNLTEAERKEAEAYLDLHPEYREMLSMYDPNITIEKPLDIVYTDKDELFSMVTAKKPTKIIFISRYVKWVSGVAAVMLLFFAIKTFYNLQNTQENTPISKVNQINEREIKDINDLKDFSQDNKLIATAKNNKKTPVISVNTDITEMKSDTEEISFEELLADNDINTAEEVSDEEDKVLLADNSISTAQKEQERKTTYENNTVNEEHLAANNNRKSAKEELIRKGVNSALNIQPMQAAIEGIAKVVSSPKTKKIINLFNERRNRKTKTVYSEKITAETSNV
ncbi:MAG: hypothetical protein IJ759_07750 [Bacteroidales bacterium]|nr:hypothetical protein [Bacteroidales bacterium]